jgi:hypothetical protein
MLPDFHVWHARDTRLLWILAHLIDYHTQGQRRISLLDYTNFMRRAPRKPETSPTRRTAVGNYLTVL